MTKHFNEAIFLEPVFKEKIWGGDKLKTIYGYDIPSDKTGEAWVVSAHDHGSSVALNEAYKGKTLSQLWDEERHLFNRSEEDTSAYPLLVKIIDANDDLSVQVHPDDAYAQKEENVPFGKTECWYILDAKEDSSIILGHNAKNKTELDEMIDQGQWDELLQTVPVQKGDFFYVPSGTIHAIGKGVVILEIQQSSDTTYRVYDYDRIEDNGQKRELHLDKSKAVTTVPHEAPSFERETRKNDGLESEMLIKENYFTVYRWTLKGQATETLTSDFLQVSVIGGEAKLTIDGNTIEIKTGQHFVIPHGVSTFTLEGDAELIVSHT